MKSSLLSICIPSYNRPNELADLLNSIDCKSSDIEIVICEDLAPKRNIVKTVVDSFSISSIYSVSYYENTVNLGFDANLRKLIEHAKGEYIMFMGDDDIFVPNALDKLLSFLKKNRDKAYLLRSYLVKHSNGFVENFRFLPNNQTLKAGENTVSWLFKRCVTLCGFTIDRKKALEFSTSDLDGTLLYQVYLMSQVCMKYDSVYFNLPFVQCNQNFKKNDTMFGISKVEKNRYTPGKISSNNSINFTKAFFELTSYLDRFHNTNLSKLVLIDLSKYSYPFLSIQRKNGLLNFLNYTKRLEKELGFGCTLYFHLYKWALIFFGEKICDKIIVIIKNILGHTPRL